MPKSKVRKGRKPYAPKGTGKFGIPDPASLFLLIGQGTLDAEEEEMACKILFSEMDRTSRNSEVLKEQFGDDWPPADWQALRALAKQSARQLTRSTDGITPRIAKTDQGEFWLNEG